MQSTGRKGKLLVIVGAWLIANFVPHLGVYLASGKPTISCRPQG
jgi:hypothetical protein